MLSLLVGKFLIFIIRINALPAHGFKVARKIGHRSQHSHVIALQSNITVTSHRLFTSNVSAQNLTLMSHPFSRHIFNNTFFLNKSNLLLFGLLVKNFIYFSSSSTKTWFWGNDDLFNPSDMHEPSAITQ